MGTGEPTWSRSIDGLVEDLLVLGLLFEGEKRLVTESRLWVHLNSLGESVPGTELMFPTAGLNSSGELVHPWVQGEVGERV